VPAEPARHILFCGTAGSGKTTVGALVARALGRDFVDIDRAVERAAGLSVQAIFARDGEAAFRERERAAFVRALAAVAHSKTMRRSPTRAATRWCG
jgi:shikimate kinase